MQSISPPRVPVWDGLRRMRGQARKTTGLPPRKQLAPRDEFHATHEMGESSHQAELRAQLQQVTQNLQGTQQSLQQCQATVEDTRMTILQILTFSLDSDGSRMEMDERESDRVFGMVWSGEYRDQDDDPGSSHGNSGHDTFFLIILYAMSMYRRSFWDLQIISV
ncbi:hypothetical protein E3N88_16320 [Mikania micrantha]|uniref:Uncharacterized protein n=1 Tax=Mikania micrantha TaxID=192012 RepID=A0A5N6NY02_9ASTR|nr:hypothetical protein E3N88_16320 [Mikania micrantha]